MLDIKNIDGKKLMAMFGDNHFDLAIIDPPYGIGEDGGKSESRCKATGVKPSKFKKKNWDKEPPGKEYFRELFRVSKNQIIFGANHFISRLPKLDSPCWIVWDKDNGNNDFADCELAWTSFETAVRKVKYRWHGMLQENMKEKEQRIHPTQKPVDLYTWILENYAEPGQKILDTHLGSGSIAIACYYYGCELTASEIDSEYYTDAINRIDKITKQVKAL